MNRLLIAVFALSTLTFAQTDNRPRVLLNTVSVSADGKFEADPDTAVINFTIATQEGSTTSAYDKASKAAEQVRAALKANGIDPKAAEFSSYSLQPMIDYRNAKRKIVGYRVTSSVSLKLKGKDFDKAGALLDSFSNIEATDNQSLNYELDNFDAAKQKAIEDAFNKAKAAATTLAKAGSRTLGDLAYASVDTFEQQPPMPMVAMQGAEAYKARAAAPTEGFTPNKITITAHVNALFNLK
jgi:uncharacterized protein YggE